MKEEFGIMRYIKQKYYREHFKGRNISESLEKVKDKYFSEVIG